jgi:hypothetical protein
MTFHPGTRLLAVLLLPAYLPAAPTPENDPTPLLNCIKAVKTEGKGNAEAQAAWQQLVQIGPAALLPILTAMPENDAIVNNWLRSAVDAIAEKQVQAGKVLPVKELEAFIANREHSGVARRLAYEWLSRVDETTPKRLLPGMLDDPGSELRRDAVAVVIAKGDNLRESRQKDEAIKAYRTAFDAARDADQVDGLAKKLGEMGVKVDVAAHYGFILDWKIVSAFDNKGGIGYEAAYLPEKELVPGATYKGKNGADTKWVSHVTEDAHGVVDLNKVLGKIKGVVAYAHVVVDSPREQPVQLRAGTMNAVKLYLNGKQLFGREEYHHGISPDQHVGIGTLKKGRNEVLVKVCQNEQTENWAQEWKFQLRLCDELGGAIPFKVVPVETEKKEKQR